MQDIEPPTYMLCGSTTLEKIEMNLESVASTTLSSKIEELFLSEYDICFLKQAANGMSQQASSAAVLPADTSAMPEICSVAAQSPPALHEPLCNVTIQVDISYFSR